MSRRLALALAIFAFVPAQAHARGALDIVADTIQYVVPAVGLGNTLVRRDWLGTRQWALSGVAMAGVVTTLKYTVDARRPSGGDMAFPSGHSAVVAWGTGFLHRRYGWKWALPGYAATGFVMWARVENDHHNIGQVFAGAAIGFASSFLLTRRYEFAGHPIEVSPMAEGSSYGLRIAGTW